MPLAILIRGELDLPLTVLVRTFGFDPTGTTQEIHGLIDALTVVGREPDHEHANRQLRVLRVGTRFSEDVIKGLHAVGTDPPVPVQILREFQLDADQLELSRDTHESPL